MNSSRPYFLRALYEWIIDNKLTPHLMVDAILPGVSVPQQYVKDGKIILNAAPEAIQNLSMTNEWVNFDARFSGVTHRIRLPMMAISAIYAVENGRGMVFEKEEFTQTEYMPAQPAAMTSEKPKGKPMLRVIKSDERSK